MPVQDLICVGEQWTPPVWLTPDLLGFVLAGRINLVPKPFPDEFRADVIAVARKGEAPLRQIAKDFGISKACLYRWLKVADRQDGLAGPSPAAAADDMAAHLREARKRIKFLEQKPRSCAARPATCPGTPTQNDVLAGPTLPPTGSPSR